MNAKEEVCKESRLNRFRASYSTGRLGIAKNDKIACFLSLAFFFRSFSLLFLQESLIEVSFRIGSAGEEIFAYRVHGFGSLYDRYNLKAFACKRLLVVV